VHPVVARATTHEVALLDQPATTSAGRAERARPVIVGLATVVADEVRGVRDRDGARRLTTFGLLDPLLVGHEGTPAADVTTAKQRSATIAT